MARRVADAAVTPDGGEGSWRDRALERSLRTARAKAISRSDRFIATAMEILQETGRTDFTVQELVERSRTSLRSFYQYFASKDELLLALLEETVADNVSRLRQEIEGKDTVGALQIVVTKIYGGGNGTDPREGLNRALASYHFSLADQHAAEYGQALGPLIELIHELVDQGVKEGVLRSDIPPERLIPIFIQTVVGAALISALGGEHADEASDPDTMWELCRVGLLGKSSDSATTPAKRATAAKRATRATHARR